ncbi:MAG: NAD(P)/FAD-dependent oxidoreductase [Oscillospiraceae bacterium]|nr:NAD(P)/FAD-dependent oxidoreductase [Candidatus Limimonas coprohippi]
MIFKKKPQHIVIAGMGQGGMVAAYYLGKAGFSVDIYEKAKEGEVSHPWTDDTMTAVFERCGIPMPPKEAYSQKNNWLWVSPGVDRRLMFPGTAPGVEISVDRHMLSNHFAKIAKEAGCRIHYETPVKKLLLNGDRIIGIELEGGKKVKADLVIDALGIDSVLRPQAPAKWEIQAHEADDDLMLGYREFFKRNEGYIPPKYPDYRACMYLKHMGGAGLSWCNLSPDNNMDMLIGRLYGMTKDEMEVMKKDLFMRHADQLTDEVVIPGRFVKIGTRYSLSKIVADGYVLVGDSAFMSIPLTGCGIESSMDAGVYLSETIIANKGKDMSAKNLWPYQVKYFHKKGFLFALIDVLKRWVLNLDGDLVDWVFYKVASPKIVESISGMMFRGMSPVVGIFNILTALPLSLARLFSKPSILKEIGGVLKKGIHASVVSLKIPTKYNEEKIHQWIMDYEASFPHKK